MLRLEKNTDIDRDLSKLLNDYLNIKKPDEEIIKEFFEINPRLVYDYGTFEYYKRTYPKLFIGEWQAMSDKFLSQLTEG